MKLPNSSEEFYDMIMKSEEKTRDKKTMYLDKSEKEELNKLRKNNGK